MRALPEFVSVGESAGRASIVFLHGLGGDHTNWRPQIDEFGSQFQCIAWTMPGYGASPPLDELTWPGLAVALAELLDHLEIERATVVGLSMGGYVAQQFAADFPSRVSGVVLAGTTAQFGRGSASFAERFLATRLEPLDRGMTPADLAPDVVRSLLTARTAADAKAAGLNEAGLDLRMQNAVASMSRISAHAYRQALKCLVTWDFTERLHEITAPALCVAAADDATAPPAALNALADGLPDATLAVIDDCNHLMNLDQPAAFNRLLRAFVRPNE